MISARYDFDAARVGLFSQAMYDLDGTKLGCLRYPDKDQFDSMFRAGRTFAVLTPMLTLTSMVCMAISLLWCPVKSHQRLWSSSKLLLGTATISQMFAFFAVGSDFMCPLHDCKLTGVGTLAAFNALLLAGLTVTSCLTQGPTKPCLQWWTSSEWDNATPPPRPSALQLPGVDPEVVHYIYGQQQERHKVDPQDNNDDQHHGSNQLGATGPIAASNTTTITTTPNTNVTGIDLYPTEEQPAPWEELPQQRRPDHSWDPRGEDLDDSASTATSTVGLQSITTFRFVFVSLVFFAWAVSIAGVQRCSFLMVGPVGEDISHYRGLGLFTRAMYYDGQVLGCLAYPDHLQTDFDSAFLASQVFGSFAALLLTVVLLVMILQFFLDRARRELWLVVRVLLSCTTIFQLLAFSVFRTNTCHSSDQVTCIPGQLGVWVILNVILLAILSVLVLIMPPPPHPVFAVVPHRRASYYNGDESSQPDDDGTAATRPTTARTLSTVPDMGPVRLSSARLRYAPTVLEPKGLKLLRLPKSRLSKDHHHLVGVVTEEEDATTAVMSEDGRLDRILRIDPLMTSSGSLSLPVEALSPPPPSPPAQFISVTVEYHGTQKHVVKTVTHPDGSQTITTTVEELERNDVSSIDGGEATDCSILGADDGDSDIGGDATSEGVVSRLRDRTDLRSTRVRPPAAAFRPALDRQRPTNIHDVREVCIVQDTTNEAARDRWETGSDTDGDGSLTVDTCMIDDKEYYSDTA